jgi:hypothetical protein
MFACQFCPMSLLSVDSEHLQPCFVSMYLWQRIYYCEASKDTNTLCCLRVCIPLSLLGNGSVNMPLSLLSNGSVKIPL